MQTCSSCGQENPDNARFCLACGSPLGQAAPREERRIISVLFVDLVGFTARAERLDPEDVRASYALPRLRAPRNRVFRRCRREVHRRRGHGRVRRTDGLRDDAERAVRAAFAVRDAFGR